MASSMQSCAPASVHALLDAVLTSDARLSVLYEEKGPLSGAFAGCTELAHRETGLRYVMRSILKEDMAGQRKADELRAAIRAQVQPHLLPATHACQPVCCARQLHACHCGAAPAARINGGRVGRLLPRAAA